MPTTPPRASSSASAMAYSPGRSERAYCQSNSSRSAVNTCRDFQCRARKARTSGTSDDWQRRMRIIKTGAQSVTISFRMSLRVVGVVTARAGSKGIPGKNTKLLGGKPLIRYIIDAALASRAFDRLILSTDDHAAADIARAAGCEVPFMRPAELATDQTPHLPVMHHALSWLRDEQGYRPDAVMTLLPTAPLCQPKHFRDAIERM